VRLTEKVLEQLLKLNEGFKWTTNFREELQRVEAVPHFRGQASYPRHRKDLLG
jgi:hypothetical protein